MQQLERQRARRPGNRGGGGEGGKVDRRDLRVAGLYVLAAAIATIGAAVLTTELGASSVWATAICVVTFGSVVVAYIVPDPDKRLAVMGKLAPLLAILGVVPVVLGFFGLIGDDSEKAVNHVKPGGETVSIYNKVTSGPKLMREDRPLRLFFSPAVCHSPECVLKGTNYRTGNKLNGVVCQTVGDRITNGNDTDRADDKNPNLDASRLWYGVRTDLDRLAYFSAIWVEPSQRGGLGVPDCSSIDPK